MAEQAGDLASLIIDDTPLDTRRNANWARLIQKVCEVDPLQCSRCCTILSSIA